jgi:iron complex outermembrane receptor protein
VNTAAIEAAREYENMRRTGLTASSVLCLAFTLASPALAQDRASAVAADASTPAQEEGLQDIVVTAEKRPSMAQKTAIALTVVDAATLKANGVGNVRDLTTLAPSVSYAQVNGSPIIGIRGVSSRTTSDPAVATSLDGFYTQVANGLNATVFDLERVEVLRGPQGTLLGRNATGGAINFITAKPTDSFAASLSGEIGNYDMFNTSGMVNLPVTDGLQVRAAFQTRDRDGFRSNPVGKAGDDEHSKAARLSVAFQPTDRLTGLVTFEYSKLDNVGPVTQGVALAYTSTGAISTAKPDPGDGKTVSVPAGAYENSETFGTRWNVGYDLGFAQFTYLGGYRHLDYSRLSALGGLYGSVSQNLSQIAKETASTWNHEIRLNSASGGRLFWQVGAFHLNETLDTYTTLSDFRNSNTLLEGRTDLYIYDYPGDKTRSTAVFGQASYEIIDNVKVEGGARYTWDKKSRDGLATLAGIGTYLSSGTVVQTQSPQDVRYKSDQATYHAAVSWQFTPQNMVYAKFDTGYKAGGFNETNSFDPETVGAYEIGTKNRFLGNRLQVNFDIYHYNYKNQQVTQYVPFAATNSIVNAGKSRYWGAELDVVASVTPVDQVNFYAAFNDAKYTDFATAVGSTNLQLAGNKPPQAPRWSFNAGYQHDFNVFGGTLRLRAQTHYESSSYFTVYNYDYDKQDAYHRSDLIASFTPASDKWTIEGYVRNLEDETVLAYAQTASSTYRSYRYLYQAPRTYGARLTVNW